MNKWLNETWKIDLNRANKRGPMATTATSTDRNSRKVYCGHKFISITKKQQFLCTSTETVNTFILVKVVSRAIITGIYLIVYMLRHNCKHISHLHPHQSQNTHQHIHQLLCSGECDADKE